MKKGKNWRIIKNKRKEKIIKKKSKIIKREKKEKDGKRKKKIIRKRGKKRDKGRKEEIIINEKRKKRMIKDGKNSIRIISISSFNIIQYNFLKKYLLFKIYKKYYIYVYSLTYVI